MKKYTVTVHEVREYRLPVRANNEEDAFEKAEDMFLRLEYFIPENFLTEVVHVEEKDDDDGELENE